MDPAIKSGFAIGFGFVVVVAAAGWYAWREGAFDGPSDLVNAPQHHAAPSPAAPKPPADPARQGDQPPASSGAQAGAPQASQQPAQTPPPAAPNEIAGLGPQTPTEPKKPEAPADKGAFDVVRVEPSGESVIAGRCPSGCSVELLANGVVHDRTVADAGGSWSMASPRFAPGDYVLGLKVRTPDGKEFASDQTVTISVPKAPSKDVMVVLNAPGAPSRVLAMPQRETAAAEKPRSADAAGGLSVGAVDAENGRFFVQGAAASGAQLRIYLNGSFIAGPVAGPDGRWSLKVEQGLAPGDYDLRVDQIENDAGKVIGRALARFAYRPDAGETAKAEPAPTAASGTADGKQAAAVPADSAPSPANAVVPSLDSVTVKRGDSLWSISRRSYGAGQRYTVIFAANGGQIRNPDLIYPGQVFVLPSQRAGGR
ncbi:LysM peptidoglycan-binding domain-containing protein [Hansschlegelia plantiphila]|uniref:Peptidoglycan-binding protein LysM n=1 Tax=Hansschlegelia plantiphila TaxID=374655 RepID=A0A9W6J1H6_9HYPH|nr:LysM peptidoglycan-binding domain-containing protein [Hansschlegelia plantiphila]GLK67535.1 peptidoglycan-binding protein LysM [Hansschlegelia plantiphila]